MPQLIRISDGPAPVSYQLGPSAGITPLAVCADVDGSGAAADFVVELTLLSPDGEVISATRTDDTVTAGDSTEATFAPF